MVDRSTFLEELSNLNVRFEALAPELEVTVRDPELGVEGYIVVWSTLAARGGPLGRVGKGGTRITPSTSIDEIKMLARVMTLKNAAAGLPLGGAKSGLRADPNHEDFEKIYRRFISLSRPVLAENGGPFGGFGFDIGGAPVHALWACDELKSTRSFTGKPLEMGGTDYDRQGLAGLGVVVAATTLLRCRSRTAKGATFAVQGLGAMGAAIVRYLHAQGSRLTAISDPRIGGTFIFAEGAPTELVASIGSQNWEETSRLLRLSTQQPQSIDSVLFEPVDLLFPAAVQNVIDETNVSRIDARMVIEAANGPVTSSARTALHDRGIDLIPDFIANPGGIIAAFVEMTAPTDADKVSLARATIESRISDNVEKLFRLVDTYSVEPSAAAMHIALANIFGSATSEP